MSTLFVFGDSFSEEFKEFMKPPINLTQGRSAYIVNHLNGVIPDGWPTTLANKLGYELENCAGINGVKHKYGGEGNCNSSIFNNISLKSEKFKKDDIVIIEWTTMERFKWVNDIDNCMSTILPNQFDGPFNVNVLENVLVNRSHYLWINELFILHNIINKLAESIGFNLFYWTVDRNIVNFKLDEIKNPNSHYLLTDKLKINFDYKELFHSLGARTITEEVNNKINDSHYSITGHNIISELFYDDIINKL
jgi:hypothetical protein